MAKFEYSYFNGKEKGPSKVQIIRSEGHSGNMSYYGDGAFEVRLERGGFLISKSHA